MRARRMVAALVLGGATGVLAGCNPAPGEGKVEVTGAETIEADGPEVTCPPPGSGGEVYAQWQWEGEVDGTSVFVGFAATTPTGDVDIAALRVGDPGSPGTRTYAAPGPPSYPPTEVVQESVDEDGTLHATAHLVRTDGAAEVDVEVTLRCPE